MPSTSTSAITASLIATAIADTREDTLVPTASSTPSTAISVTAPQSKVTEPSCTVAVSNPKTVPRYCDQPLATTDAASANSRMRSQPMIQATSSPKVAYE